MSNEIEIRVKSKDMTGPGAKSAKKNLDDIGNSAKRVGDVAKGVLAAGVFDRLGQAAAAGLKSTFTAAKDLGESVNAVNVSFGASADKIHEWGQNNAASFGLSTRAFNQFAVPLGAVMKNVGLDMDLVSDKTIGLTERAADMASVFNADVSEVLQAIQAGLRGEADPLEKFGVGLNAAAVEAKALADSGKDSAEALTEQEKMLARVALIMEQTSQVQGDFANTSGEAANAQRIATAEMENAKAVIGQALLPVMAMLAQAVAAVARVFQALPEPVQSAIAVVGTLGAVSLILVPKVIAVTEAIRGMGISAKTTGRAMLGVLGPIGLLIATAVTLAEVLGESIVPMVQLAKHIEATEKFTKSFAESFDAVADAVVVAAEGQDHFAESTEDAEQSLEGATKAIEEYVAAQRAAVDPVLGLMDAIEKVDEAQSGFNEALKEHGKNSPESQAAARELASAVLGASAAAADADLSFDGFKRELGRMEKQGLISKEAADVLRGSIKETTKSADKFQGNRVAKLLAQKEAAQRNIDLINNKLNELDGKTATTYVNTIITRSLRNLAGSLFQAHGGITPAASHAAEGGPRGNRVWVGEQGPELVDLAPGSMVHPAGTSRAMAAAGAAGEQRIVLELRSSGGRVDELLLEVLRNAIRVRGGDVQVVLGR